MGAAVAEKMSSSLLPGRPSCKLGKENKPNACDGHQTKAASNTRVEPAAKNVPRLVREHVAGLSAASVGTRYHAAENLAALGPAAGDAVPPGFRIPPAVPALREVLRTDSSVLVRKSAAIALGEMGSAAQEAISDLRHAARNDEDQYVRKLALQVIEELGFFTDCSSPKKSKLPRQSSL